MGLPAAPAEGTQAACPPSWLGATANGDPQVSDDGRFVVFTAAPPGAAGGSGVIALRDLSRQTTTLVSRPFPAGWEYTDHLPALSGDGNRVGYLRSAADVGDNNAQLWVYDRRTRATTLEGIGQVNTRPDLSANGRYLTYARQAPGDSDHLDVYVRDVDRDVATTVTVNAAGQPADGTSIDPEISANGRFVLFRSYATDLTPGSAGAGRFGALYVHDVRTRRTTLIPDRAGGIPSVLQWAFHLSPDGRDVVYTDPAGVWRYDRRTGRTAAASRPTSTHHSADARGVSAQGRRVLLAEGTRPVVREVRTGRQVVVAPIGYPGAITPDARYVTYTNESQVQLRDLSRGRTRLVSTTNVNC